MSEEAEAQEAEMQAQKAATKIVPLKAGGQIGAIVPQSIEEVFRLAQGIAASGLAPKSMDTPEQVTVAILTGMELGLPPMFAIQKIAVINGRPSIWGDAVPALLWSKGFKLHERIDGDGDAMTATCDVARPDGQIISRSFSVAKAKKAGLWGKSGPWSQHPERMLQMRARGFACRDGAADVLSGLYLAEELQEPIKDITPPVSQEVETITPEQKIDVLKVVTETGSDLQALLAMWKVESLDDVLASKVGQLKAELRNAARIRKTKEPAQ